MAVRPLVAHVVPRWSRHVPARARAGAGAASVCPGLPLALLTLLYGALLVGNTLFLLAPRLSVGLSADATGHVQVSWLVPQGIVAAHGVRVGDSVLALDDRAPTPRDAGLWQGRRLRVQTHDGHAALVTVPRAHLQTTWPLLLLSPLFLLLGTLILRRAASPVVGRATYAFLGSIAAGFALAPGSDGNLPLAVLAEWIMVPLVIASFLHFCLVFPMLRGTPLLRALPFALPLGTGTLGLVTLLGPDLYDGLAAARGGAVLTTLLLGGGLLVSSWRTTRDAAARRGVALVVLGTLGALLPLGVLALLPTWLGQPPLLAPEWAALALALLPASYTYAVLRYHVLATGLLQRWFVHGLVWGLLVLLTVGAVYARNLLAEPARLLVLVALLLAWGLVVWSRERLHRGLDRLVFKDGYDYPASLHDLSRDLSRAGSLEALGAALPQTLRRLLNLDFALLLGVGDQNQEREREHGRDPCVYGASGTDPVVLLPALRGHLAAVPAVPPVAAEPRVVALADGAMPVVLVPLRTHNTLVGHLCLGPKASGEPFRRADHALLTTLSGHLAALVQNAHLVDQLRAQVAALDAFNAQLQHAQEEERARLAADLHAEPLQTALYLRNQLAALHGPKQTGRGVGMGTSAGDVGAPLLALSETLIAQVRAVCLALRPSVLADLGLAAALDLLAQEQSAHSTVLIRLDAAAELAEVSLPPDAALVLYRVAQEALTNSLRHAQPATITMTLRHDGDGVQLEVVDDGVGFVVPATLATLVAAQHFGLADLHERVRQAGGTLTITAQPGQGTRVQAALPVQAGAAGSVPAADATGRPVR